MVACCSNAPLGMAELAAVLWGRHLKHHPGNPHWVDRDRLVLSNRQAPTLRQVLLRQALLQQRCDDLPVLPLPQVQQLGSMRPGHLGLDPMAGVETTSGPPGQGLPHAVGMALAERRLAAAFNRDGFPLVDHRTWVLLGDGCLMAGISQEAISLAGALQLGKLVALYVDSGIPTDAALDGWSGDDIPARFQACGWQVIGPVNAQDPAALDTAVGRATDGCDKPTLIVCRTTLAKGGEGGEDGTAHHECQGRIDQQGTADLRAAWDGQHAAALRQRAWDALFAAYAEAHPALAVEFLRRQRGSLPAGWAQQADLALLALAEAACQPVAPRRAFQLALDATAPLLPELLDASDSLRGSKLSGVGAGRSVPPAPAGHGVHADVRAFGMAAVVYGMARHGGLLPCGLGCLSASDGSRSAIRLAALVQQRLVHVFTQPCPALGEGWPGDPPDDLPDDLPVDQLAALRLIPGLDVWRPADLLETAVAWVQALQRHNGPSALVLSCQALPAVAWPAQRAAVARGGYVLADAPIGQPAQAVILATGAEVGLALDARARLLQEEGISTRVVSMPCTQRFDAQPEDWRDAVLPPALPTVVVEAGHPDGWYRYTGRSGAVVGIVQRAASATRSAQQQHLACTADAVMAAVRSRVAAAAAPAATRH